MGLAGVVSLRDGLVDVRAAAVGMQCHTFATHCGAHIYRSSIQVYSLSHGSFVDIPQRFSRQYSRRGSR